MGSIGKLKMQIIPKFISFIFNSKLPFYNTSIKQKKLYMDKTNQSVKVLFVLRGYNKTSNMTRTEYVSSLKSDDEVAIYYRIGLKKKLEQIQERVIQIRRVTKVVKGGKQLSLEP